MYLFLSIPKIVVIFILWNILFPVILLASVDNAADIVAGVSESGFTYKDFISGNFRVQYEGRWAEGNDEDHDTYDYLRFKTKPLFHNKVTISGSGRFSADLDGREPESGAFRDILDSYDHQYNGRIYYLYADIQNPVVGKSSLRLGRQYVYSLENILFDGAKYEQQIGPVESYVFGGLRVSQYSSTYFDTVTGSGVAFRPFVDTRTTLDYVRIIDNEFNDDEVGLNLWQKIYEDVNFYGRYTLLNTLPKDFMVKLSWDKFEWDANIQVSYYRFFHSLGEQSNNISPFFQLLGTLRPFELISMTGYKGFGEKLGVSSGFDYRSVIDIDDEDTFNHDYNRTFLSFNVNNLFFKESKAAFTVEYWNVKGIDHTVDIGVDYDKKIGRFDVGVGTSYSVYKYNFVGSNDLQAVLDSEYTGDVEQKINVRTYYLRLKYLVTTHSDITMRWTSELSDTDPGTFHQIFLSYSMNF
ncbi:hypothetical protein BIY37_05965 [Candidatus Brocadia sapporoensis]|uniref:Alginate export domain-containing protein n=1 Tax=Candidatus Brocadia sapporoensis TaxID=392547 RepID=A0A1V6M0K7_9BACT|nr:hypothetical protein [Candidatus Brocadia sapporoensis]MDG6006248.1 hypothetical protein [Candidatus Brocadia sp.]OQD45929.1 hypothetical protein BIY37_05965 [Candidatus Brocadia sapporoensis]GJQ24261.1 MAG: hypothetical protein HBSAPP01_20510 [Candidatus Brocadia sapporoensis]